MKGNIQSHFDAIIAVLVQTISKKYPVKKSISAVKCSSNNSNFAFRLKVLSKETKHTNFGSTYNQEDETKISDLILISVPTEIECN